MGLHYGIESREAQERALTLVYTPDGAFQADGNRENRVWTGYWEQLESQARSLIGSKGERRIVAELSRLPDGLAELRVTWEEGKTTEADEPDEGDNESLGSEDDPTYTCSSSTYEASILTHPRYKNIGSPAADALKACIDGAQLEDPLTYDGRVGKVKDFFGGGLAQEVYDKYISKGVVAYLEVSTECTCRFKGRSNRYTPGQICHPPGGVRTPSGRNWLCTGSGQERVGNEVWSTASFRLSGPDGWDPVLYK